MPLFVVLTNEDSSCFRLKKVSSKDTSIVNWSRSATSVTVAENGNSARSRRKYQTLAYTCDINVDEERINYFIKS